MIWRPTSSTRCWRAPPARPPDQRGLSLFLVPKFLPDAEGGPGPRNEIRTLGLEHKLGIHASPTCVLAYEDAVGWRIGEENRGLEYMFTMMNNARLNVGLQGVAIAERAYQQARDFARTRVQGRPLGAAADAGHPIPAGCRSSIIPTCGACCCGCAPRPRRCARSPIMPRR